MNDERRQTDPAYDLYLDVGDADLDVESPIRTTRIDYYDSGVWIDRDAGRAFFPYERVLMIAEVADADATSEAGGETATDLEAESAEPATEPVSDERDLE